MGAAAPTPGPGGRRDPATPEPSEGGGGIETLGFAVGLLVYFYLGGLLIERVRLSSARLPADLAGDAFGPVRLLATGLRATLLAGAVFAVLCLVAWLGMWRSWDRDGPRWHAMVRTRHPRLAGAAPDDDDLPEHQARRAGSLGTTSLPADGDGSSRTPAPRRPADGPGDRGAGGGSRVHLAPLGDTAVRVVAGVNTVAIAAIVALVPAQALNELIATPWAFIVPWLLCFLALYLALRRWGPQFWGHRLSAVVWPVLSVVALFVSPPLGILILATAFVATFGRVLARFDKPTTIRGLVRSPVPWAVLVTVLMVALAYAAIPPVSYPTAVLATASGRQQGAYLGRTAAGVYIASCITSQTSASSIDEHVALVPGAQVRSLQISATPYRFDSGKRPSLLSLAFHAIGGEGDIESWINPDLRSRAATCDSSGTEGVTNDAALGTGVLVGPGPASGRATDGEAPIQQTSPVFVAALARRYQPTLLVTVADRNWPVSVDAVLAERGAKGNPVCLVGPHGRRCPVSPDDLGPGGSGSEYLQLPTTLTEDSAPEAQFEAFMRGQELEPGSPGRWLADPGVLKPWSTAQIYFYLREGVEPGDFPVHNGELAHGLTALEYWFYYPYNYYPSAVATRLMGQTPLAAERARNDLHQGDWEHVDVLVDPSTYEPKWLYLARHSNEGRFIRWSSAIQAEGHPVVQAAYGGHPSYEPACGPQRRDQANALLTRFHLSGVLNDWLVCGSGRLGFAAATTPLVDLAYVPWACWPGYFGEAKPSEIATGSILDAVRTLTAGPKAPLLQAENSGVCRAGPKASEQALLKRLQDARPLPLLP